MKYSSLNLSSSQRQILSLGLSVIILLALGAIALPDAIAKTRSGILAVLMHPVKASISMLVVCGISIWVAWRTRWLDRLGNLSSGSLFLLGTAPVIIPYLTNNLGFAFLGSTRPSWQLWFLRDATPYFEGALLAAVMFFALMAAVISRQSLAQDQHEAGIDIERKISRNFVFAVSIALWTMVISTLGKHPLVALSSVAVIGIFWIIHHHVRPSRCTYCFSLFAISLGYLFGIFGLEICRFVFGNLGIVAFSTGLGIILTYCLHEPDEPSGWRPILDGAKIWGIACSFGLGVSVLWNMGVRSIDIILGDVPLPAHWSDTLNKIGFLNEQSLSHGFTATQARETLASTGWTGSEHIVMLPHAWDDFMLLTVMEKYGWTAGAGVILALVAFMWLTLAGIRKIEPGFLRTLGLMLWSFLALSSAINVQANLGILPGVPFLGLPILSYHWFLAVLGGLVTGLALRGLVVSNHEATSRGATQDHG